MLNNAEEDNKKLEQYNKHITNLESLFRSTIIIGKYEGYRLIPSLMLFNFINLLRGIAILDYNHMLESGNIVIRSMFEVLVDFLYCETDRKLYLRFSEYLYVEKILLCKNISSNIKNKISEEDHCGVILKKYENFKEKYNITDERQLNTWCNKSIYMRVKIVSEEIPEILELYYIIYKKNCEYVHPFVQSLSQYVIYNNGNIEVNYQNNYNKDKFYLIKQVNSLVKIFSIKFEKKYGNATLADIDFQK